MDVGGSRDGGGTSSLPRPVLGGLRGSVAEAAVGVIVALYAIPDWWLGSRWLSWR